MSLLIPALLSQVSPPAGPVAKAYDLGKDDLGAAADRNLYKTFGEMGLTDSTSFTFVWFLQTPADAIGGSTTYYVARGPYIRVEFPPFTEVGGGCRLKWWFYNTSGQNPWEATTTTYLMPSTKYCIALAMNSDGTRQLYVNGVSETIQEVSFTSAQTYYLRHNLDFGHYSGQYYNLKTGPFWFHDGFVDLSTNIGNFVTDGTTPVDNANGCKIYMKMDDLTNDGSGGDAFTAPAGIPFNTNW